MADTKISALATASTIVSSASTTLSVIVQGGTTKQTPVTAIIGKDYEEGTWTPVIEGGTTAGAGTYSVQTGVYTKIGNIAIVSGSLAWSAHTGTGSFTITGLPFSADSPSVGALGINRFLFTYDYPYLSINGAVLSIASANKDGTTGSLGEQIDTACTAFNFSITYRIA